MSDVRIVKHLSYSAVEETDLGILDKGFAKGLRFIGVQMGFGATEEEALAHLAEGTGPCGYGLRLP